MAEPESLKARAVTGVKWTGTATTVITGVQYVQLAILAHLLVPEDFGLMGMVMVVIGFAQVFSDMGMSKAIIHRQEATQEELSTLYWLNHIAGLVVFILAWFTAPLVMDFYHQPRLLTLMRWAAVIFLVVPFGQQFQVLLEKELQFRRLARVEMTSALAGAICAVAFVLSGWGVLALIWGELAKVITRSLLLVLIGWTSWRPSLRFKVRDLRGYLSFGLYQMGERTVNYFAANVDYLVIGRFLGPTLLGSYLLAYQLVVVPLLKINPVVNRVAFPVFAIKQTDEGALRRGYLMVVKYLALITMPLLVGMAVTAPLLIPVAFGGGWELAIPLVQILVGVGILKSLSNPIGSVLLAKGRADIGFKMNVLVGITNTLVFWLAVSSGVYAVAWSYLGLSLVYLVISWLVMHAVISLSWREFVAILTRPTAVALGMGLVVWGFLQLLNPVVLDRWMLLLVLVVLGAAVDLLLLVALERGLLRESWQMLVKGPRSA